MKRKIVRAVTIFGLILALVSCNGSILIYTYVSDLLEIAKSSEKINYVTANIVVQGLKDQNDIQFLRDNLNSFSNEKTVKVEYSDALSFETKIPIVSEKYKGKTDFSKDLIFVIASEDATKYSFKYEFNFPVKQKIIDFVKQEHYQTVEFKDFLIKFVVDNDTKESIEINGNSVYVNGVAYPFNYTTKIARREKIEFEISEVFRNAVSQSNIDNPVFSIKK